MNEWQIATGSVMTYAACVLLFQGGERRARHEAVSIPTEWMARSRNAGRILAIASLIPLLTSLGLEVGVTVWIALLALAGVTSLLISALFPKVHLISPIGLAGLSIAFAFSSPFFGGSA